MHTVNNAINHERMHSLPVKTSTNEIMGAIAFCNWVTEYQSVLLIVKKGGLG